MLGDNERGYVLLESLMGLMLLSVVSFSLVVALPILLEESIRLDKEQAIYHQLLELHGSGIDSQMMIMDPIAFEAFRQGHQWCATYIWRDGHARTICL
ncbi:MAG: hypothetical protein FWG67_00445 [Defluviitaleaceae bacterium]|nr:hypothetical protein [Defluviitaleaceae bacterium]